MNILVTGATGGYGNYAIEYVRKFAPEANVYGLVRNEETGKSLIEKGFQIRIGDYSDYDSMVKALEGIDRLLFVSVAVPGVQKNVVDAAKAAGVKYIAYTSLHEPQYVKFGLEINHKQTESWIVESGIPHTFLRDSWYLEMPAPLVGTAIQTGVFPYYAGEGKVTWAMKREYAEAGARVITGEGYPKVLELAGPPVSYRELGEAARTIAGRDMEIKAVSKEEFTRLMTGSGISEMGLMLGTAYQDYALAGNNGEAESSPAIFEQVLGHPLMPLAEALKELLSLNP